MQITTNKRQNPLYAIARKRGIAAYVANDGTLYVWCGQNYEDVHTIEELNRKCKGDNDNGK